LIGITYKQCLISYRLSTLFHAVVRPCTTAALSGAKRILNYQALKNIIQIVKIKNYCIGQTAFNRSVCASPPSAARVPQNTSRANALYGVLLHHSFAVAGTLRVSLSQPQNRRIQPERYMPFF